MTTILMLTNCLVRFELVPTVFNDNQSHAASCRGMTQVLCSSIINDHYEQHKFYAKVKSIA